MQRTDAELLAIADDHGMIRVRYLNGSHSSMTIVEFARLIALLMVRAAS